jgi:hypothetical protein
MLAGHYRGIPMHRNPDAIGVAGGHCSATIDFGNLHVGDATKSLRHSMPLPAMQTKPSAHAAA